MTDVLFKSCKCRIGEEKLVLFQTDYRSVSVSTLVKCGKCSKKIFPNKHSTGEWSYADGECVAKFVYYPHKKGRAYLYEEEELV